MYTYVSAKLFPSGNSTAPIDVNISAVLLHTVFKSYKAGYVVLTNPALSGLLYMDINELQGTDLPLRNLTFTAWLAYIGNLTIPTSTVMPNHELTKQVLYRDAAEAGLIATKIHSSYSPTIDIDGEELSDALLTSQYLNVSYARDFILTTVSGYLHYSYPRDNGLCVRGAARTLEAGADGTIGLLNFFNVGEIAQYEITTSMLKNENSLPLHVSCIINLGVSLVGKSVLCSIGGVLHGEYDVVSVIDRSGGLIKLKTGMLDLAYRYMTSRRYIDLTRLNLNLPEPITRASLASAFKTDAAIKDYMTSPYTFIVIVDTERMTVTHTAPLYSELYGTYSTDIDEPLPLTSSTGRIVPYRRTKQQFGYALTIADDSYRSPIYITSDPEDALVISDISHHSQREKLYPRYMGLFAK